MIPTKSACGSPVSRRYNASMPPDDLLESRQREVLDAALAQASAAAGRLAGLLSQTEEAARRAGDLEALSRLQEQARDRLVRETEELSGRHRKAGDETEALQETLQRARSQAEREAQAKAAAEEEVRAALDRVRLLGEERDALTAEREALKSRLSRMEEAVDSLRKARDEYLAKVEGLKARHDELLPR